MTLLDWREDFVSAWIDPKPYSLQLAHEGELLQAAIADAFATQAARIAELEQMLRDAHANIEDACDAKDRKAE